MNFIRGLIEIPILFIVILLAVTNNGMVTFSLQSFGVNVTISLSLLIIALFFIGYFIGRLDGYVANAPLRSKLHESKKAAKILNKEHQKLGKDHEKLNEHFSHLKEDLEQLKFSSNQESEVPFKTRLANFFRFKKD